MMPFDIVRQNNGKFLPIWPARPPIWNLPCRLIDWPDIATLRETPARRNAAQGHPQSPRQEGFQRIIKPMMLSQHLVTKIQGFYLSFSLFAAGLRTPMETM